MENLASESKISINVVLPVYRFGHEHRGPDKQTARRRCWPWASLVPVLGRPPLIGRWITSLVIATLLIAPAATAFAQSGDHGDGHAQMHDIYQHWHPPLNPGTSCCNNADCRPTRAYVDNDGYWRAWNGVAWLLVPQERVLPSDYAGDGRSHLCEKVGFIYCFTPGEIRG
jgi:hypothetical protein